MREVQMAHWSPDPRLQAAIRVAAPNSRIKSNTVHYPDMVALRDHLSPQISEIQLEDYETEQAEARALGLVPMLHYFGDDPAAFEKMIVFAPPMINLNRADLLLAALRRERGDRWA